MLKPNYQLLVKKYFLEYSFSLFFTFFGWYVPEPVEVE